MLSWLKRLLGRRLPPPPVPLAPSRAAEAAGQPAAAPADAAGPDEEAPPLSDAPGAPDAAWALAMAVEEGALAGGEPRYTPEEQFISEAVLDHFETHRPGPASFPAIALQVMDLARQPEVDLRRLAGLIEMDAALSAGVMVLANSAIFRGVEPILTPADAIRRLGTAEVARLVTALSTRSLFQPQVRAEFETFGPAWNRLFYHSAVVARTAANLATLRRLPGAEQAFVGGMLHDVGKSIALRSLAALALEGQVTVASPASMARILHRVHVEVGREVHLAWRLPDHLLALASLHHEPVLPPTPDSPALHLVRLVSALHLLGEGAAVHPAAPVEARDSARALGLGPARVRALRQELVENGEWVRLLFGEESGGPAAAR